MTKIKECIGCRRSLDLGEFGKDAGRTDGRVSRCGACLSPLSRKDYYARRRRRLLKDPLHKICSRCDIMYPLDNFSTFLGSPVSVCRTCQKDLYEKRKALAAGANFSRTEIFERDKWVCGICGNPIDNSLRNREPMSASIDHIWPISLGGPHVWANVQAAHLRCNTSKNNTMPDLIAALLW